MREYRIKYNLAHFNLNLFIELIEEIHHLDLQLHFRHTHYHTNHITIEHYIQSNVMSFEYREGDYDYHYMYHYGKSRMYIKCTSLGEINFDDCTQMIKALMEGEYILDDHGLILKPTLIDRNNPIDFKYHYQYPILYLPYNKKSEIVNYKNSYGLFHVCYENEPLNNYSNPTVIYPGGYMITYDKEEWMSIFEAIIDYSNANEYKEFDEANLMFQNLNLELVEEEDEETLLLKQEYEDLAKQLYTLKQQNEQLSSQLVSNMLPILNKEGIKEYYEGEIYDLVIHRIQGIKFPENNHTESQRDLRLKQIKTILQTSPIDYYQLRKYGIYLEEMNHQKVLCYQHDPRLIVSISSDDLYESIKETFF